MIVIVESTTIWLYYQKQKRQNVDSVYENPDKVESNPRTEVNVAYECIHNPRGEMPTENITSQPQTQENIAYECIHDLRGEIPTENLASQPQTQENVAYGQVELH